MIGDFIYKYSVDPILNGGAYNPVDTLTYATVLIVAVYLVYRWLVRSKIVINGDFIIALLPFVVLGATSRVVEDTGVIPFPYNVLFITPLIYFVIFFYTVFALLISRRLQNAGYVDSYHKLMCGLGVAGVVVSLIPLAYVGITQTQINLFVFFAICAMGLATSAALWAVMRYVFKWEFVDEILYKLLIFGQLFDASATSFGLELHEMTYVEQHVVGSALIEATGTAFSMYLLKLLVLIPGIYILEMYRRDGGNQALWHMILFAMVVVGLAPGIRDMVRMVLYV